MGIGLFIKEVEYGLAITEYPKTGIGNEGIKRLTLDKRGTTQN